MYLGAECARCGYFAALEEPEALAEIPAFFRELRS
jgi:hypothetical protein